MRRLSGLMRSGEAGGGRQPDSAPIQPGMHPIAVEFDLMQPFGPVLWLVDQFGKLRFDPTRPRCRLGAPPSAKRSCHVLGVINRIRDRSRSDLAGAGALA